MIFEQYQQILTSACSGRLGFEPRILVFHWTGGWGDAERAVRINYFTKENRRSAHFTMGRPGEIIQSVDTDKAAWNVSRKLRYRDGKKRANQRIIGVEICNRGYLRGNDWNVLEPDQIFTGRHPNPRAHKREWERFSAAQVVSIEELTHTLFEAIPSLEEICGHSDWCQGKPGSKLDPGPAFPWDKVRWPGRSRVVTYDYETGDWIHRISEVV